MATSKEEPWIKVVEQVVNNPSTSAIDDSINIGGVIVAPCGPMLTKVNGTTDFLNKFTVNGAIPRNAHISLINAYYLSAITPLVIARASNSTLKGGIIISKGLQATKGYFDENNQLITKEGDFSLAIPLEDSEMAEFSYAIADCIIYHGTMPELIETANLFEVNSVDDIVAVLTTLGGVYFTDFKQSTSGSTLTLSAKMYNCGEEILHGEVSTDTEKPSSAETELTFTDIEDLPAEEDRICAFVAHEYCNADFIKFSMKKSNAKFLIEFLDGNNSGRYYVSFNPNSVDNTGTSDYADVLNNYGFNFDTIIYDSAETASAEATSPISNQTFGATPYNDTASESSICVNAALNTLQEQELYDIDGLCLFGLQTTSEGSQLVRQFAVTGADNKWFVPFGVPYIYQNRRTIANWVNGLNLPEPDPIPSSMVMGSFDKNSALLGWVTYIDTGVKYWERVVANKALNKEFAPVFKEEQGQLNMSSPMLMLKKTDRELLLKNTKPINWVCQNPRTLVYYLNQNWSWTNVDNIVQEENVCRCVWKISRDLDYLLETYFAKYNTRSTRQQVCDLIDYYFRWNIMNQEFHPEDYNVVCDTSNNPDEIIKAYKMQVLVEVSYNPSVKYITCINRAYPIGVEFSGEM